MTIRRTMTARDTIAGESYLGGRRKIALPTCVKSADNESHETPGRPWPGRVRNAPSANVSTPHKAVVKKNNPVYRMPTNRALFESDESASIAVAMVIASTNENTVIA